MSECVLRSHLLETGVTCNERECVFWSYVGVSDLEPQPQCALQYLGALGDADLSVAERLLRMKQRHEAADALCSARTA